jgi:cobalt/nickel transport system permease protein
MFIIDKLAYSSKLRYKSPILKAFFSIGALLLCVGFRSASASVLILVIMAALTVFYSKVSFIYYAKIMAIPLSFLLLGTIAIIVNITDVPMGLFSIGMGSKFLVITESSLLEGGTLILVSLASVSCLYFLTLTTPMIDILYVLKRMRCPSLMIELMMLIYRFIFVVLDMASTITTSQRCRLGNKDFVTELKSMGQMLAVVLVRALNKTNILFDAMESRCYTGELPVLHEYQPIEKKEAIVAYGLLAVIAIFSIQSRLGGGILW